MKIQLDIPEELSDITLEQYLKYLNIVEKNPENEIFLRQKMMQIFCGMKLVDVEKMKEKDFMEITNHILAVLSETPERVDTFTLDGVMYGFIPDLDEMTTGEYVDLDTNLGDPKKLIKVMSVLYRPVRQKRDDKYSIAPYTGKVNEMLKYMPMDAALGSMVFFYHLGSVLLSITQNSFQKQMGKKKVVEQVQSHLETDSGKSGVGISQLTSLHKATTDDMKKLLLNLFISPYYTWLSYGINKEQKQKH